MSEQKQGEGMSARDASNISADETTAIAEARVCLRCGRTESGWRYNRCPNCGEMAEGLGALTLQAWREAPDLAGEPQVALAMLGEIDRLDLVCKRLERSLESVKKDRDTAETDRVRLRAANAALTKERDEARAELTELKASPAKADFTVWATLVEALKIELRQARAIPGLPAGMRIVSIKALEYPNNFCATCVDSVKMHEGNGPCSVHKCECPQFSPHEIYIPL